MEVSTVSTPPSSSTEEDDQCGINVSNVAIHSVTLLICLGGLVGNGAVAWFLGFRMQRRSIKSIVAYILDLTAINFLFLLFMVTSTLLFLLEDLSCSTIMPPAYRSFLFLLFVLVYTVGLYRLMAISIERCKSFLCRPGNFCHVTQDLSWVPVSALLWALSITVIAVIATVTSLCQSQEQKHCRVLLNSLYVLNFVLFAPSMVISSTILFIHFKDSSKQQQSKKLDIIVFLTVLLTLPISLWNLLQQFGYTTVSSQVVFLFTCIHSSINPFIYFSAANGQRHCSMESLQLSLQTVFEEPEEKTACSNDPTKDTVDLSHLNPSTAPLKDNGNKAEGFLEPPD